MHLLSVIYGLIVHPLKTAQEISGIYQQLLQQSEFWSQYLYVSFDQRSFCLMQNGKMFPRDIIKEAVFETIKLFNNSQ